MELHKSTSHEFISDYTAKKVPDTEVALQLPSRAALSSQVQPTAPPQNQLNTASVDDPAARRHRASNGYAKEGESTFQASSYASPRSRSSFAPTCAAHPSARKDQRLPYPQGSAFRKNPTQDDHVLQNGEIPRVGGTFELHVENIPYTKDDLQPPRRTAPCSKPPPVHLRITYQPSTAAFGNHDAK